MSKELMNIVDVESVFSDISTVIYTASRKRSIGGTLVDLPIFLDN